MDEQFLTKRYIAEKISSVGCTNIHMQARVFIGRSPMGAGYYYSLPPRGAVNAGILLDVIMKVQGKSARLN